MGRGAEAYEELPRDRKWNSARGTAVAVYRLAYACATGNRRPPQSEALVHPPAAASLHKTRQRRKLRRQLRASYTDGLLAEANYGLKPTGQRKTGMRMAVCATYVRTARRSRQRENKLNGGQVSRR